MSAFVVSPTHIDVLLSVALHGPSDASSEGPLGWSPPYVNDLLDEETGPLTVSLCTAAGAALLAECIASVSYRYSGSRELPGPIPTPIPEQYEFSDLGSCLSIAESCKALDCFEYQSCEHRGWLDSGARLFGERLRSSLTSVLPGTWDAPWEWSPEILVERGLIPGGSGSYSSKEAPNGR
jgi:hypothetical protein